jgi:hypothetical protein
LLLGGDYFTLAIFVLVAFLTTFFSKNMVVILCISLVISTIMKSVQVKEGLELSNNDLNTIEKIVEKFGGGGVKEGNTDKKNSKEDSDKDTDSSEKNEKNEKNDSSSSSSSSKSDSDKKDSSSKSDKKDSSNSGKSEKNVKNEKNEKNEKKDSSSKKESSNKDSD